MEAQEYKLPKQNSWETGKTGNRHKIYYDDADDLQKQINRLNELGFKIVKGGETNGTSRL